MSVSVTVLASPGTSALTVDRGRGGDATGTRFGAALALAELDLPSPEFVLPDGSERAPVAQDESTDAPAPAAPLDTPPGGPPDIAGPPPQASAPLVIAPVTVPVVSSAAASGSSADEAAASADSSDSGVAGPAPAAVAVPNRKAAPAEVASAVADEAQSRPDASPAPRAAWAAVGSSASTAAAGRATPAAPEAFQPTAPEPAANPPELPAAPPTLAPRETADPGETAPAHRAVHVAPVAAPPVATSVPATASVEASDSSAATPRAVAAQVSPAVVAIAQRPSGTHQLTMTVHPESLGPVTVRAQIGADGDVRVELVGATDAGRDALRAIVADLRRDLAAVMPNASLSLASATGEAGAHDRGTQPGAGDRPGDQPPGDAPTRGTRDTDRRGASVTADLTAPTNAHAAAGLDIFV